MTLFKKKRRRSRQSGGKPMVIVLFIVAAAAISLVTPDARPSAPQAATERRATVAARNTKAAVIATARATPTLKSSATGCYRHSHVWLTGRMNIRQSPSTSARILGSTAYGDNYAVAGSRQGNSYCWLDTKVGWIAVTGYVSATKPQAPATTSAPAAASNNAVQQALDTLQRLTVARENRCSPYDSDDYAYPQSVEPQIISRMGGRIYGPYTGTTFAHRGETDIEHVVARSEAHDSGLCAADAQTRQSFARDLLNLTLASPTVNRSQKVAKDFAEWTPARNTCWYAATIVKVKSKYRLAVDSHEKAALENALRSCSSLAMN
ncbi:MAG: DUF1524 domain-containing protein [Chloroflexi bacterium]|nr:DUF1524 domain-containing protein [Chloroflexota bacterium]MCY4247070.1 DUF1524 domain-containing protein [Chloroflexota bacterium]